MELYVTVVESTMYKRITKTTIVMLLVSLGVIAANSKPAKADDPFWGQDKATHLTVSTVLAIGGYAMASEPVNEPWQRTLVAMGFSLSAGLAKEVADAAGLGKFSGADLFWDAVGATAGALIGLAVDYSVPKLAPVDEPPDKAEITTHRLLPDSLRLTTTTWYRWKRRATPVAEQNKSLDHIDEMLPPGSSAVFTKP